MRQSHEVDSGECRVTRGRLITEGATTCIILAALNTETRVGLLGHLTHDDVMKGDIVDDAIEAIRNLGPGESTQIRLARGGIYLYDDEFLGSEECNRRVEQSVRLMAEEHGIPLSSITVSWLWGNDEANAEVDCHKGTITVNESFNWDVF